MTRMKNTTRENSDHGDCAWCGTPDKPIHDTHCG